MDHEAELKPFEYYIERKSMAHMKEQFYKVAEVELVYKSKVKAADRVQICCSRDAYQVFAETWDEGKMELQEQFKILMLDTKNNCLAMTTLASGGISNCLVDLRLAFATALKVRATAMILAHNHPSGNLKQSEEDVKLTKKFVELGELHSIRILDHLIMTADGYTSFSDQGNLPSMTRHM